MVYFSRRQAQPSISWTRKWGPRQPLGLIKYKKRRAKSALRYPQYRKKQSGSGFASAGKQMRPISSRFVAKKGTMGIETAHHHQYNRYARKLTNTLANLGALEKKIHPHARFTYERAGTLVTSNTNLASSSAVLFHLGDVPGNANDQSTALGFQRVYDTTAFKIPRSGGGSLEDSVSGKEILLKNIFSEITISTRNLIGTILQGSSTDPWSSSSTYGFMNVLNFRLVCYQVKQDARNVLASGPQEISVSDHLLQGYSSTPHGLNSSVGGEKPSNLDLILGRINYKNYKVLKDVKFTLCGQTVAGLQNPKYPAQKKITLKFPVGGKVQMGPDTQAVGADLNPQDMNDQYMIAIFATPMNDDSAVNAPPESKPVTTTVANWNVSYRGSTSFIDG